jgi:hypothetical protein
MISQIKDWDKKYDYLRPALVFVQQKLLSANTQITKSLWRDK